MGHPIGMFNSVDQSKTESWIDFAGGLLRVGVLRCEVIIFPYLHLMALRFLGSWCEVQKSPLGFCLIFLDCCSREDFIYGQSPKERHYYNRKRGIIITAWCCMRKRYRESMDHLLLHCPISYELWTMVYYLFGLHICSLAGLFW